VPIVTVTVRLSLEGIIDNLCFCPSKVNDSSASGCLFFVTAREMEYLLMVTSLKIMSLKFIRERSCCLLDLAEPAYSSAGSKIGN
jgi:hypothetical protein